MAEDKHTIYILAIVCIVAIFLVVFFVNNYLQSNKYSTSITFNGVGQAAAIAQMPGTLQPIVTITDTPPCAYMNIRDKVANSAECN
jgi:hypothetical protein